MSQPHTLSASPEPASRADLAWRLGVAFLAAAAILIALLRLGEMREGLRIETRQQGSQPVTVFRPADSTQNPPVVLVAHGFAGSQQLMQPLALTLARNGYVAVTFDFPGHGRNAEPMRGGLKEERRSLRVLMGSMEDMRALALQLSGGEPYAVLGHSMASDIVVRHAQAHPDVAATVAISLFAPSIKADTAANSPRNLLVVDGALEPDAMTKEALRVTGGAALDDTRGDFVAGTARLATLAPGVEHIGVLYSRHTLAQSVTWLDRAFGKTPTSSPALAPEGPWIGLLLAGVVALAWPLSFLLPRAGNGAQASPRRRWWAWRGQAPVVLLPALLTPIILWKVPGQFLPILLGDYLLLHFALYGLLTLVGMWHLREPLPGARPLPLVMATSATALYALLAVGLGVNAFVLNLEPVAPRMPLIAALVCGTLPWFLADEWMSRSPFAARGTYLASKCAFLASLVLAIALNPGRLFFLAIIVPAILLLFVVYGLFSRWTFARTGHPAVAAVANALAFAWFVALSFPLVE